MNGTGYLTKEIEKDYYFNEGQYIMFHKNEDEKWHVDCNNGHIDTWTDEEFKKYVEIKEVCNLFD